MAITLIRVNVAYPKEFSEKFTAQTESRRAQGERKFSSGVDDEARNLVYVVGTWESVAAAKRFWGSTEAKRQIAEWHSVEAPVITVLRESPED